MQGLIGRKIGMTQVFADDGTVVPVTVLEAGPCPVVSVKTSERDGYAAVQLAFGEAPARKLRRPQLGHLKKHGVGPHRVLREMRLDAAEAPAPGSVLNVGMFAVGEYVDVCGITKGRGFQGVVKRHGYTGGPASHGSKTGNLPGSIGASADPSHVIKGRRLPGQMGNVQLTVRHLLVVRVDAERNLLAVRGAVPGSRRAFIVVRKHNGGAKRAARPEKKG